MVERGGIMDDVLANEDVQNDRSLADQIARRQLSVRKLHNYGMNGKQIARLLNIPYTTVVNDKRLLKLTKTRDRTALNQRKQAIYTLHEQGYSPKEIANNLSIERYHVYNALKDNTYNKPKTLPIRTRQILTLHADDTPPKDIAKQLNISLATVYRHLEKGENER